jgi:hypothetical protein
MNKIVKILIIKKKIIIKLIFKILNKLFYFKKIKNKFNNLN